LIKENRAFICLLELNCSFSAFLQVIDFGLSKTYGIVADSPLKKKGVAVNANTASSSTKASSSSGKESNIMKTRAGTVLIYKHSSFLLSFLLRNFNTILTPKMNKISHIT